jgi:hypothetical protein
VNGSRIAGVAWVLVASTLVLACGQGSVSTAEPRTSTATPTASPQFTDPMVTLRVAEMEEPLPHVFGGSQANAVVAFRDGLLAFGGVNGGCCDGGFSADTRAVIWASDDGRAWTIVKTGPELAFGAMRAAAASRDRVVVIGRRDLPGDPGTGEVDEWGAVWTSDDGRSWRRVDGVPIFTSVVTTSDGFVAASAGKAAPELWLSATGDRWERIAVGAQLGNGRIEAMVATPNGYLAVGSARNWDIDEESAIADPPAAVWYSADGRRWERRPTDPTLTNATMMAAASSGNQIVVLGWAEERDVLWTGTALGDRWELGIAPGDRSSSLVITTVMGLEEGFLLGGNRVFDDQATAPRLLVLGSTDGRSWEQVAEGGQGEVLGWAVWNGAVVAVGSGWNADVERPVPLAWTLTAPSVR